MMTDKDLSIVRQVLLKIASEQTKGSPEQIANYAKELEKQIQGWLLL